MDHLGIISGTVPVDSECLTVTATENVATAFGAVKVLRCREGFFIARHGSGAEPYILPHSINHQANIAALRKLGATLIVGVCSTGSLKRSLPPGTIVVPEDFISFSDPPTAFTGVPEHILPVLSENVRRGLIETAAVLGLPLHDGGVYWQTRGPRFETKAEIRFMACFADLVGMTMAGEATAACAIGVPYGAICSVDNFGHGLADESLTVEGVAAGARRASRSIFSLLKLYGERINR
ncbi:MAG: MTAP family purine nucleoside phosphorylase [Deltaproteobacteria bacterium]|nr:MTAP family purine nucleoside phosphorylase [Deltaproteobacteria bacterium]